MASQSPGECSGLRDSRLRPGLRVLPEPQPQSPATLAQPRAQWRPGDCQPQESAGQEGRHAEAPGRGPTMREASSSSSRLACCTPCGSPSMRIRLLFSLSGGIRTDTLYWSLILLTLEQRDTVHMQT